MQQEKADHNTPSGADRTRLSAITALRSLLFFILYNLLGMVHSLLCVISAPFLAAPGRQRMVNLWNRETMWLLRYLNGIHIEVSGQQHISADQPMVVVANHQSQWETFYLQLLIMPLTFILKRELLRVPFFGWALALQRPIAIDRSKASTAMKALLREGKQRLASGHHVLIFPEGSRQPPGTLGAFLPGGAMLARQARVSILPVVHNAGDCWPARSIKRLPGTIRLVIGEPITTEGKSTEQLQQEINDWMRLHYP